MGTVATLAVLAGCGDDDAEGDVGVVDPATATIVYRFNDASVPPEYHRSYTLTADAESVNLVVDSYGDVLHNVTEPNVDDLWQDALDQSLALSNAAGAGELALFDLDELLATE